MTLRLTEDQVLFFRAKRGHLVGPGATSTAAAARALLGAQSQQLAPSLLALSLRTKGRPTAQALEAQLFEAPRKLVRTWGQRDTLFVFDPEEDWAEVVAARAEWRPSGLGGKLPSEAVLAKALETLVEADEPLCRSDLAGLVPKRYLREIEAYVRKITGEVKEGALLQFATGRLFRMLAYRGEACFARKVGSQQSYATRSAWFSKLAWKRQSTARDAAVRLADRYLSTYGPATATDLAHFFGARVAAARGWLDDIAADDGLIAVLCGDRKGLFARRKDAAELGKKSPSGVKAWPVRLLPLWDAMLMGHADKRWAVPDPAEEKRIWRPGGYVAPTVLARGRIVATWKHKQTARRLEIQVQPLSAWRKGTHEAGVRRDAKAMAQHLSLETLELTILT